MKKRQRRLKPFTLNLGVTPEALAQQAAQAKAKKDAELDGRIKAAREKEHERVASKLHNFVSTLSTIPVNGLPKDVRANQLELHMQHPIRKVPRVKPPSSQWIFAYNAQIRKRLQSGKLEQEAIFFEGMPSTIQRIVLDPGALKEERAHVIGQIAFVWRTRIRKKVISEIGLQGYADTEMRNFHILNDILHTQYKIPPVDIFGNPLKTKKPK